jgi:hypothetical protein
MTSAFTIIPMTLILIGIILWYGRIIYDHFVTKHDNALWQQE